MYKFTVEYYYAVYHTGGTNLDTTRTAIVFACNKAGALAKIKKVDDNFISVASMFFEEVGGGSDA